ncbi:MAG: hypothetical protein JWQ28_962 [Pedobacter sp.]|jgi:hypothetical protein|nr:hypothetical protein [Pedobacter sp.]
MKRTILKTILVCAITCSALMSQAQRRPAPRPPRPPRPPIVRHEAPLDGSLTLLIGASIAFGIYKAYSRKNEGDLAH